MLNVQLYYRFRVQRARYETAILQKSHIGAGRSGLIPRLHVEGLDSMGAFGHVIQSNSGGVYPLALDLVADTKKMEYLERSGL